MARKPGWRSASHVLAFAALVQTVLSVGPACRGVFASDAGTLEADRRSCEASGVPGSQDRVDACTRVLTTTAQPPTDRARLLFERSDAHRALGTSDAALSDIDAAIRLDAGQAEFFLLRASLRLAAGDAAGAIADDALAIGLKPDDLVARRSRAEALMDSGRYDEALPDLDAILRARPDDGEAYNDRGLARWRSLSPTTASSDPDAGDDGFLQLQRQICREVRADCSEVALALADLGRAVDLMSGPDRAVPLVNRAEILAERGDLTHALADYDDAVRLRPDVVPYRVRRAEVRQQMGDLGGARADLDGALALRPDDAPILLQRAKVRRQAGDLDGARADLDAALRQPAADEATEWLEEARSLRRAVAKPGEPGFETDLKDLKISKAEATLDSAGQEAVLITLDAESRGRFAAFTTAHIGGQTQILIDGTVIAEPRILSPITGGVLLITGSFTSDEARSLASRLGVPGAAMMVHALD